MTGSSPMRFADGRYRVTSEPLDSAAVARIVSAADCGAVVTFVGLVRDHNVGRRVLWLDYEAYEPLALKAFEQIDDEAADRWPASRWPFITAPGAWQSARRA